MGEVLHVDGRCYSVGGRGPCDEMSVLLIDPVTSDPVCKPRPGLRIKRIFDLAPNTPLRANTDRNAIIGSLR